jgi:hypothetical protein
MADLFLVINNNAKELLTNLRASFPEVQKINDELRVLTANMATNPRDKTMATRLNADLAPHLNAIHSCDAKRLLGVDNLPAIVTVFSLDALWPRLLTNEKSAVWSALHGIVRFLTIVSTCGDSLESFDDIAQMFVKKNGNQLDPAKAQSQIFAQLFSDKEMSKKLLQTFENGDTLKSIISNVGNVITGMTATVPNEAEADESSSEEEEENEEDIELQKKKLTPAEQRQKTVARKRREKKRRQREAKKAESAGGGFGDLIKGLEFTDDDIKELQEGLKSGFGGGDEDGKSNESMDMMKKMMQTMSGSVAEGKTPDVAELMKSMTGGEELPPEMKAIMTQLMGASGGGGALGGLDISKMMSTVMAGMKPTATTPGSSVN